MINTAIILAGGLGTRLRSAVADLPKCMAPIDGNPFISFIITYLKNEGIGNFIFSLGYKSEVVIDYVEFNYPDLQKKYVVEQKQLGTGGAIKEACKSVKENDVVVVNGDTMFNINLRKLSQFHSSKKADCTIALKEMENFERYGVVETGNNSEITAFKEKQFCIKGCINGGIYALSVAGLNDEIFPEVFSFEKEYLEKNTRLKKIHGIVDPGYFIDIGIPEDYQLFKNKYQSIKLQNSLVGTGHSVEQFLKELNK